MRAESLHTFNGGTFTVLRDNVLLYKYTVDFVEVQHDESARNKRVEVIGKVPFYNIIDLTNGFITFTKEAKNWAANNQDSAEDRIMDIVIVSSWGTQLEAQIYGKISNPKVETKIVRSLEKALELIDGKIKD